MMQTSESAAHRGGKFRVAGTFWIVLASVAGAAMLAANRAPARSIESPIFFRKMAGQLGPVLYSAETPSFDLFISRQETDVVLHDEIAPAGELPRGKITVVNAYATVLRLRFVNASLPTSVVPLAPVRRSHLAQFSYAAVAYRGIYAGTDVILRGNRRRVSFQVILSPGADPNHVVLQLAGATSIKLNAHGDAMIHSGRDSLVLRRPVASIKGSKRSFWGAYKLESGNRLRFIIPALASQSSAGFAD